MRLSGPSAVGNTVANALKVTRKLFWISTESPSRVLLNLSDEAGLKNVQGEPPFV